MALLKDIWFPNLGGGSDTSLLASHAYMNLQGNGSVSPVIQDPGRLDLVTDPVYGGTQTVMRMRITQATDTRFSDSAFKVMLNDRSPTASDPITDWAGSSAVRRWYRFSFCAMVWPEETQHLKTQQLCCIWQLHDQKDNSPDVYVEPPLWLIDNGQNAWELWNTYDPNQNTSDGTKTRRLITSFPRILGQWEDIVIWMKPSWTSGALKVWRNGTLIFTETGVPNCFNHQIANGGSYNFIEYGAYGGKSIQTRDREIYHRGCQVGDESYSTFNAFMTACGSTQTENTFSFPNKIYLS